MTLIHLSQLVLEPTSRGVISDLRDCHALHRRVMGAFGEAPDPAAAREYFGVLHRVEVRPDRPPVVLVQSNLTPNWGHLPDGYLQGDPLHKDVTARYAGIKLGMHLRFRLRGNPTRKIDTKSHDGARRNGRRVELTREADQLAWLRRKAQAGGFDIVSAELGDAAARIEPKARSLGRRDDHRLTIASVVFEGILQVTDLDAFHNVLISGIGTAKAFGCGLLSVGRG